MSKPKLAVIRGDKPNSSAQRFVEKLNEISESKAVAINYADLIFDFHNSKLTVTWKNQPIEDVAEQFYIRDYHGYIAERYSLARYLKNQGAKVFNSDLTETETISKLEQLVVWSKADLAFPDTVYQAKLNPSGPLKYPLIIKGVAASNGNLNFLVENKEELVKILKKHPHEKFLCQEYIENDSDYRVCIVNGEVAIIYRRQRVSSKTHLNNVSKGAKRVRVDDQDIAELAKQAAAALKREFCGVDILRDKNSGKLYLMECNFNHGMSGLGDGIDDEYYRRAAKLI